MQEKHVDKTKKQIVCFASQYMYILLPLFDIYVLTKVVIRLNTISACCVGLVFFYIGYMLCRKL